MGACICEVMCSILRMKCLNSVGLTNALDGLLI